MEIFVGCSSSKAIDTKYLEIAKGLGELIGRNGHHLVFGSSKDGLMGEVYRAVRQAGGKITSILPNQYRGFLMEVASDTVLYCDTSSDQLKMLVNTGDMTILLPGSFGTLAELTASIQFKKLEEHKKEIIIINAYGFYNDMLSMFDKIYKENYDCYDRNKLYHVVNNLEELTKYLKWS